MAHGHNLDDVVARVADGEPVDWNALQETGSDAIDREWMEALRVLDHVAAAHRALPLSEGDPRQLVPTPQAKRWGKFLLTDRLGAGSFGEVYRGWDHDLRRDVAIKLLYPAVSASDSVSGRLLEEGRRLASVRHENVISVLEVEQHGGQPALCMEFIRGRTLADVVQLEGTLSELEAARIGVAVCGALAAVHAAGLVHRDVKANNVMRGESGRIVLMDFGSGMRLSPSPGEPRATVGTPLYMAPELFEGASATPVTDVYSVGVLLYFLVSGHYPVEAPTIDGVREAHRRKAATALAARRARLFPAFVDVVNAAINPDPGNRYPTAEALQTELERVVRLLQRRRSAASVIVSTAGAVAAAFLFVLALGFLTSSTYEFLLGISGPFATESWRDDFMWGLRSLVAPAAMAGFVTGLLYLALEYLALLEKLSLRLRRVLTAIRSQVQRALFLRRVELRDVARVAVLGSVAFLAWVPLAGFPEFVRAFTKESLSTAPEEALRLLGPASAALQDTYRQTLSAAVTLMCVVWMTLWRAARRHGTSLGSAGWLGLGCVLATVALMDAPYRILFHYYREPKERARYAETDCYVTAASSDAFLLFCPVRQPRVLSVSRDDPLLTRHGTFGNLFETVK